MKNENDDTDELESDVFGRPLWMPIHEPISRDSIPPSITAAATCDVKKEGGAFNPDFNTPQ